MVSFFTASITSALTVGQLSQRMSKADDLDGMRVASIPGSTSAAWVRAHPLQSTDTDIQDHALAALDAGTVDAVVYDAPLMRYTIQQHYARRLQALPLVLARQDYAFALPRNSPLRQDINTTLLRRINRGDWRERLKHYFGTGAAP